MLTPLILTGVILCLGLLAFIAWNLLGSATRGADPGLKAELDRRSEEVGELKNALKEITNEKMKKEGEAKQLWAMHQKLESDYKALTRERDSLTERMAKHEAERDVRERRTEEMTKQLENGRLALDEEKKRVRREDEERQQRALAERDRLWAEHEHAVVSLLNELAKKPQYAFTAYDNTNLPEGFHGTLKPDFLIEFLDQYVIFDAKVSKSTNMQTYIAEQVKSTAKKVKGKEKIYPTIFLVIPTDALKELKKTSYYEEGVMFYVIPPEALEPVLASLKKIATYEFAQEMDPQEREQIVDLVAQFQFHISTRNAHDLFLIQHGIETLSKMEQMKPEFAREAAIRQAKIRNLSFNTAQEKTLAASVPLQQQQIFELIQPKAKISKEELEKAQ